MVVLRFLPCRRRSLAACLAASLAGTLLALAGCASSEGGRGADSADQGPPAVSQTAQAADGRPQVLVVLLDGTRNDASSLTNVFLMKKALEAAPLPATLLYLEGVGSPRDRPVLGATFGMGMETRINAGYRFLSSRWRPGDRIVIMGFSRGAHQARALAGLVAYAGLMDTTGLDERRQIKTADAVIDMVKAYSDRETEEEWRQSPDRPPRMAAVHGALNVTLRRAPVDFLGVWDTVPGSSFKEYGECRELPDRRGGERYKTGSYPGITRIAHAVALDEKRSMFRPILLCPALRPDLTSVSEVWFAGAHADVGGGYESAPPILARVSLAWMAGELSGALGVTIDVPAPAVTDMLAPAHWSMGDSPANLGSRCEARPVPGGAVLHPSVALRLTAGSAPLVIQGKRADVAYPFGCSPAPASD